MSSHLRFSESLGEPCLQSDQGLTFSYSHPGYFGKCGMRTFRLQRNQHYTPVVNLDKIWSLVSEQTRKKAEASKDKAAVIDVTKAVNYYFIYHSS